MTYTLAIDFGTTWTSAAVGANGETRSLTFSGEHRDRLPSLIWIDDDSRPRVGEAALNQWRMAPERLLREPKALLGKHDDTIAIGGELHPVEQLVGAVLSRFVQEARDQHDGDPPEHVVLTHPARWGRRRTEALLGAARAAGIEDPGLVSEPEAAARELAGGLAPGECLAVYDLGGGTFDTAVLKRTVEGFELLGEPGGDETLGGERFDDRLREHVGEQIAPEHPEAWEHLQRAETPAWRRLDADLRQDVRRAKEALSHHEDHQLLVPVGEVDQRSVLIRREELHELIAADVRRSYDLLDETIERAGCSPDELAGVYLTGASSKLLLVRDEGRRRYPAKLSTRDDPKAVVARGAAREVARPEPEPDEDGEDSGSDDAGEDSGPQDSHPPRAAEETEDWTSEDLIRVGLAGIVALIPVGILLWLFTASPIQPGLAAVAAVVSLGLWRLAGAILP